MNINWLENPIMQGIGRVADFVMLNLLWIICSLPIITIGASTAALYTVMLKLVKNEEGYIVKGFFKAFKENFKQSTIMELIFLVASVILVVDFSALKLMPEKMASYMWVFLVVMLCLLISTAVYAFSLQARFVNTVRNTLKNALILVFAKLPFTALLFLLTAGPVFVTFLNGQTLMIGILIWLFGGVALVVWLQSFILRHIYKKLEEQPAPREEEPGQGGAASPQK